MSVATGGRLTAGQLSVRSVVMLDAIDEGIAMGRAMDVVWRVTRLDRSDEEESGCEVAGMRAHEIA